jgi:Tol biopolymer transport system component
MVATPASSGWQDPRVLFADSRHSDRSPAMFPDGSAILFASDRPAGADSADHYRLWLARTAGPDAWADPVPVEFDGGWAYDARQPSVTRDGTLYFSSDAPGGWGEGDIWVADRVSPGRWSAPRNLGDAINGPADEHGAFVAPDGSWMVLTSAEIQPGRAGGDDLWLSRRTPDGWSPPVPLGLPVNTFANEYGAWVSPVDGALFFTSDRYGNADIFRLSAREAGLPVAR